MTFADDGELAIQGYYGAESVAIQPDGNIVIAGIDGNALPVFMKMACQTNSKIGQLNLKKVTF